MKIAIIHKAWKEHKYTYWDGNWNFNRREEWFYLFKFVICVLFGWHIVHSYELKSSNGWSMDFVPMVMDNYQTGFNGEFSGADWEEYGVAYGLRDWYYTDYWNGYP